MAHYSRVSKVVIDVSEDVHDAELRFWEGAAGVTMHAFESEPAYHGADLPGQDGWLLIQRLGEGPSRVHLDVHTDDLEAEVARLEKLGARRVRQVDGRWWIMEDPAGLPFCVIPDERTDFHEGNARRWD
ncbi:VOC family protein [Sphaerisporangium sp. NPDC005288]|uniref:VOC family protein n=1 Tax=Sphaerisporangium sp. NPDC005288 TaxID=3155114 RepID=UPI0033AA4AF5